MKAAQVQSINKKQTPEKAFVFCYIANSISSGMLRIDSRALWSGSFYSR